MTTERDSEFMQYLANHCHEPGTQLAAIPVLAEELGISVSKLREQLEVARSLGLIEVRPKVGIQVQDFSIFPGLQTSLRYGLAVNPDYFQQLGILREHVEASFWHEAVRVLSSQDVEELQDLIDAAWDQLRGQPISIPHAEHKALHLKIFSRLENIFVQGVLEAYWEAYEIVGLNLYTDYQYLEEVWHYHAQMVAAIAAKDYASGYQALIDHFGILYRRYTQGALSQPTR